MKKTYITPSTTPISVRTVHMLTASENEYSDNQGHIHFENDEVSADDGD